MQCACKCIDLKGHGGWQADRLLGLDGHFGRCPFGWSKNTGQHPSVTNTVLFTFRFQIPPELPGPEQMTKSA